MTSALIVNSPAQIFLQKSEISQIEPGMNFKNAAAVIRRLIHGSYISYLKSDSRISRESAVYREGDTGNKAGRLTVN